MSRMRTIHPGFFSDDVHMELSPIARLFLIGLWVEADDQGVFQWRPKSLSVKILPGDLVDVTPLLENLTRLNIIKQYQHDGVIYGVIRNFCRWQRPKTPTFTHYLPPELHKYVAFGYKRGVPFPQNGEMNDADDTMKVETERPEIDQKVEAHPSSTRHGSPNSGRGRSDEGGRRKEEDERGETKPLASQSYDPARATKSTITTRAPGITPRIDDPARPFSAKPGPKTPAEERLLSEAKAELATPKPQITANKPPDNLEPHERVRIALSQILGPEEVSKWIGFPADFANMLASGLDPDLDIIPAIRDVKAVRGDRFQPRSLSYCMVPVMDFHERRTKQRVQLVNTSAPQSGSKVPDELRPTCTINPHYDLACWDGLVEVHKRDGKWQHWIDGPPPDHPDSFVPLRVCEKYGISRRSKQSVVPSTDVQLGHR